MCACDKMFKSKWTSYVLYLVMMMNLVTFSCETFQRVYRNGIVMGQELYKAKADSIVDRLSKIISVCNKYGTITYVISWICFIALCAETVYKMWRKKYDTISPLLIITGMALSYLVFIIGVAYTHISAFSAISYMYLSSAYPVIIATEWLLILTETEKVISLCSKFFAKRGKKNDYNA